MSESHRQLVAIMFTDVVGYTTVVGQDEARGVEAREKHRSLLQTLVSQFHGHFVEETGDETLSTFASSVDAVSCALAVQGVLANDPDLAVRIGIHVGDVLEKDHRLIGDGVNVAARLRPLAEAGGICVSERVYEDLRSHPQIQAKAMGPQSLKNVERPIGVYAISREGPEAAESAPIPATATGSRWRRAALGIGVVVALLAATLLYPPLREAALVGLYKQDLLPSPYPTLDHEIAFTTTRDGVRIAYSSVGSGPPVVVVLGWFTHLERGGTSIFATRLVENHRVIQYDGRGTGLSDRGLGQYGLETRILDLEAVVAATGLDRFGMLGISAGGPTAITYAARNPERVTRLAFFGSFAYIGGISGQHERWSALVPVVRTGWGEDNPAFRQLFTSLFMPDGDNLSMRIFNEHQKHATSGDDAADFILGLLEADARAQATELRLPALVTHLEGDAVVPFEFGRQIASLIPGARLVSLEGNNHAFLPGDPGVDHMHRALSDFFAPDITDAGSPTE